jgi:DNA-binding FadR family transcriptional regulator
MKTSIDYIPICFTSRTNTVQKIEKPLTGQRRTGPSVADAIARRVVGGEWPEGAVMPTEIELAEALGVARTSVREALGNLKAKGMLVSRPKTGTRVLPRVQWNMLDEDVLRWCWSDQNRERTALHLTQLRRIVEPAACEIAAASASDTDIAVIERAYRAMDAAGTDPVAFAGPDLEFHRGILRATGNPFLISLGATIETALRLSFELSSRQPGAPRKGLPMHRDVLDAIWARKPVEARLAMETLLGVTESNIQRGLLALAASSP